MYPKKNILKVLMLTDEFSMSGARDISKKYHITYYGEDVDIKKLFQDLISEIKKREKQQEVS